MSHFYADIQGNRGEATRCGSKDSGIQGHIRGWNVGAFVVCGYDKQTDSDVVIVYATKGSSGYGAQNEVFRIVDGKIKYADNRLNLMKKTLECVEATR